MMTIIVAIVLYTYDYKFIVFALANISMQAHKCVTPLENRHTTKAITGSVYNRMRKDSEGEATSRAKCIHIHVHTTQQITQSMNDGLHNEILR